MTAPKRGPARRKHNAKEEQHTRRIARGAERAEKVDRALAMLEEGVERITSGEEWGNSVSAKRIRTARPYTSEDLVCETVGTCEVERLACILFARQLPYVSGRKRSIWDAKGALSHPVRVTK